MICYIVLLNGIHHVQSKFHKLNFMCSIDLKVASIYELKYYQTLLRS